MSMTNIISHHHPPPQTDTDKLWVPAGTTEKENFDYLVDNFMAIPRIELITLEVGWLHCGTDAQKGLIHRHILFFNA